jgi:hypothetical protein
MPGPFLRAIWMYVEVSKSESETERYTKSYRFIKAWAIFSPASPWP